MLNQALQAFPLLAPIPPQQCQPLAGGLINLTYQVGDAYILQRLHPIFQPEVNLDIAALTPHLQAQGVPVPSLLMANTGLPYTLIDSAEQPYCWRAMTRLPGLTHHRVTRPDAARALGRALAAFHRALAQVDHPFAFARLGIHDTAAHLDRLQKALAEHPTHRLYAQVAPLAHDILRWWQSQGPATHAPQRIGHGDPKVSNFLFHPDRPEIIGIVDLDTMGWTTLEAELGDALRSWGSTHDESANQANFDLSLASAALQGYAHASRQWIPEEELLQAATGVVRIAYELSARFLTDALEERYFGWDPTRAPSRGAHNLLRARNQLALAQQAQSARHSLTEQMALALRCAPEEPPP